MKKLYSVLLIVCMMVSIFAVTWTPVDAKSKWQKLLDEYEEDEEVDSLIFVKYKGGSNAELWMYVKDEDDLWFRILKCKAVVGRNGIDKVKQGDKKTPTGIFTPTVAFGLKKDPGAKLPYTKLNKYLYWSSSEENYNKMVDIRKQKDVRGEHLIDHNPSYTYSLDMGYNVEGVYKKGTALFMHCYGKGDYKSTLGCVAVSEKNMKKILRNTSTSTRICIYKK